MLTHTQIERAVKTIAKDYPLKRVSYFGSYADGRQTDKSDLDLLVEFRTPSISLFTLADIKNRLEDELEISVDIIHAPLPDGALITVEKTVAVYEQ